MSALPYSIENTYQVLHDYIKNTNLGMAEVETVLQNSLSVLNGVSDLNVQTDNVSNLILDMKIKDHNKVFNINWYYTLKVGCVYRNEVDITNRPKSTKPKYVVDYDRAMRGIE